MRAVADPGILGQIAMEFLGLSMMAIGGVMSTLGEMHRVVVDHHRWMTSTEFAEVVALSQAAPGPNILVVTLVGWKVAGFAGALVATLAMCGPTSVITLLVAGAWQRFRDARWRIAIENGLAPVTIGLMIASAFLLVRSADQSVAAYIASAMTVMVMLATRINPLWLIAIGAVAGYAGLI